MANISVNSFTFKSIIDKGTIIVTVYADGKQIKDLEFSATGYNTDTAIASAQFTAENFGILGPGNTDLYEKGKSVAPPPQEVSATTVYKYDIKKYGPQKYIVVYEIGSTGERQIFEGNKLIGAPDDNLIQTAKLGLEGKYPGVATMTRKTPAPSPVPTAEPPVTPSPSSLPLKLQTTDPPKYLPQAKYKKAKKATFGQFIVKDTQESYEGYYIETYKKQYFAGQTPEQNGVELEKIEKTSGFPELGKYLGLGLSLLSVLQSAFKKQLSQDEINKGIAKRYFVQDNRDKKISETSEDLFEQGKKDLPNFIYTEVPWHITNPIEDIVINGIKFQGSESRNKETIQKLESTVPGISKFVTDYRYLTVEPPQPLPEEETAAQIQIIKDPNTGREDFRKARFDERSDIIFPSASIWAKEVELKTIVQEGLLVYLDASNPYWFSQASPTLWWSLIPGSGGGSLPANSFTKSTANGGNFSITPQFSINYDNLTFQNGNTPGFPADMFSISYTIKITQIPAPGIYQIDHDVNLITQINANTDSFEIQLSKTSPPASATFSMPFDRNEILNNIINIVWTFDGTAVVGYLNGIRKTADEVPFTVTLSHDTLQDQLAFTTFPFNGNVYDVLRYSKPLIPVEVLQNYEAIRFKCLL